MKRAFISTVVPAMATFVVMAVTPAAPVLKATPDAKGLLKTEVVVTSPDKSSDGNPLSGLSRIELRRNGDVVKVFDVVEPGKDYIFNDIIENNGYVDYSAVAYSGNDHSLAAEQKVFVGVDVPLPPTQFKAVAHDNRISFTWGKSGAKGVNGERVNRDELLYQLELLDDNYDPAQTLCEIKGRAHDYHSRADEGEQDLKRFGLRAYNAAGKSEYIYTKLVVGAPYYFPFHESFAGGNTHGMVWQEGDGGFVVTTEESSDSDAGMMVCIPAADGTATSLNLGKMSMTNTLTPRLSFRTYGLAEGEKLVVKMARADGAEATVLTVTGPQEEWKLFTADLSAMKNERYLIPKFQLAAGNKELIALDDIRLYDPYPADLGVRVFAPESGYGAVPVKFEVTNEGLEGASLAFVDVYVAGKHTETLEVGEELAPGEVRTLESTVDVKGEESVEVKARVRWAYDVNTANDIATAEIIPSPEGHGVAGMETTEDSHMDSEIFRIDGTRVPETDPSCLPAGIYIIDGKTVIINFDK